MLLFWQTGNLLSERTFAKIDSQQTAMQKERKIYITTA